MVEQSVGGIVAQLEKQTLDLQQQVDELTETVKALRQQNANWSFVSIRQPPLLPPATDDLTFKTSVGSSSLAFDF